MSGLFGSFGTADISPCGAFRWRLTRRWDRDGVHGTWIMLNPSTADAAVDDPTIRRVLGFSRREGWGGFSVVNLYAVRSADPAAARQAAKEGDDVEANLRAIDNAIRDDGGPVVFAWGAHGWAAPRASVVEARIRMSFPGRKTVCLGVTADGSPRHPLYVRSDQPFVEYRGGGEQP